MPPEIQIIDERFTQIVDVDASIELVADGMAFTEGPAWIHDGGYLIWSDIPNNRIMRWSESGGIGVLREPSQNANGNAVDADGNILTCETSGRRVSIARPGEPDLTLVDSYDGKPLTSPNDVVVKSDGSIWFSDPDYGSLVEDQGHGQPSVQEHNRVYRLDRTTGELTAVAEDFDKPNGLAFSPDESVLYVSDSGATHGADRPHHVRALDVVDGKTLANSRVVCEVSPPVPDGLRVDTDGNLYVTSGEGVQVFTSNGEMLGKFVTPEVAANCCFGMADRHTLFICATSSVWMVRLKSTGAYLY
ncbi:MAG: SMP-30/gluconolactonase/LRE family protein [Chloroflexi bacterium]|jgi:gluconolactonase|nr:SMP-30/gluconolactonase/LRE family protein [Chloroflexota bacterium]MBT4074710.1 SMP-30/gluconolactonase/LRE family protein [Chloroflexota bacterium]MBT4515386.1 SMP-30/gluconolactonase/LRE family protein [Chloroflexota bacterium]MBT5319745.1 SMP-30/gluconolactonase/LRE family protein [Chloroflexota bacterium]MBT6682097.1 SMP-30/gluconolactonase/LRE family protein [Chloroflexota bacterium]